jgi:hypothetical protein
MLGKEPTLNLPSTTHQVAVSPRDVVFVLFRRRWVMLAIALPIIILGGVSLLGRTSTSTAATRVVVEFLNVDRPQWNITGRNIDFDRELSTLTNIAMSVSVAEDAAEALADSLPAIRAMDPNLVEIQSVTDLRDLLLGGLDVNIVGESNILEFRHTDPNPRIALMAAGAMRTAFIRYENFGRRKAGAVAYYEEQLNTVRADIDSLLAVRGAVLGQAGFSSLEDELRYSTGDAAELENQLRKVQVDRAQLESEYNHLKGFLERDPREFPAGQDESRASTLVGWRDLVGKQEDALNSILSIHTDDSVPARRQKALLEQVAGAPAGRGSGLHREHSAVAPVHDAARADDPGAAQRDQEQQQAAAGRVPAGVDAGQRDQVAARPDGRPAGQVGRSPHERDG